jgi:hypothetical protein
MGWSACDEFLDHFDHLQCGLRLVPGASKTRAMQAGNGVDGRVSAPRTRAETGTEREARRREMLDTWATDRRLDLSDLDVGQQWVLFAGLQMVDFLGAVPALKRLVGYFLAHCGMGLNALLIAAVIGVSDRSVRQTKAFTAAEMLHRVRHPVGGHRKMKLKAQHAGVVGKYLVEHPQARVKELIDFIGTTIGPTLDRLTLRRYLKRFGLGCLRGTKVGGPSPLFSAAPVSEERSS